MMELFIETLTGTAFELRVSPFETIMSVKAKIQRLEGIPISQQHLIWQSMELEDDYCLHDYSIHDGATLKLVLAMRGGPINTRRIAMEDPALREMAEYMEANREEILDKLPGNRQVTLLVYREGDQLNFFRVVDRGDGTLTPLSESLSPLHFSGASMYNLYDDDDEDEPATKEIAEENVKTKEKMALLRNKMENLTLTKKPKKKSVPRPPSSGRPGSRTRSSAHRLGSSAGHAPRQHQQHLAALAKNPLPPLGQTSSATTTTTSVSTSTRVGPEVQLPEKPGSGRSSAASVFSVGGAAAADQASVEVGVGPAVASSSSSSRRIGLDVLESAKIKRPLSSVKEDFTGTSAQLRLQAERAAGRDRLRESTLPLTEGKASRGVATVDESGQTDPDLTTAAFRLDTKRVASATSTPVAHTSSSVAAAAAAAAPEPQLLKNKTPLPPTGLTHKKGELVDLPSPGTSEALQKDWTPSWSAAAHSYSARKKEVLSHSLSMRPPTSSSKGLERLIDHHHHGYESSMSGGGGGGGVSAGGRPTTTSASSSKRGKDLTTLESLVRPPTSKYSSLERKQGLMLESLSQSEARGLLRQASIERLGSSKLANFVRSASKSRASYHLSSANLKDGSRVSTPEGRLVSARLQQRMSASRDRVSPTPRLPPVKQKKKASKRCFVCAKKTGLATSYQCRCGNNFCATHRYAESHDCTFDYKTEGRKLLEQANPVVSAPKLPKI